MKLLSHYKDCFIKIPHLIYPILFICFSCKTIVAPVPEKNSSFLYPIKQKVSVINIPIDVKLSPVFEKINLLVPKEFIGSESLCEGISYSYIFKRKPIKYKGRGSNLLLNISGKYSLNLNYCPKCTFLFNDRGNCIAPRLYASCGINEPMRKLSVNYSTRIKINKNYSLYSTTKFIDLNLIDPCKITAFKYDATVSVKKEFKKSFIKFENEIDNKIREIKIKSYLIKAWEKLSEPIKIGEYGFLFVQPEKISLSPISYLDNSASLNFSLFSHPVILSNSKENKNNIALPELSEHQKQNGFRISLDIKANYDSISSILNKKLKDSILKINGHVFRFKEFSVSSACNNQIAFKVAFNGKKKGDVYLVGTPTFNKENQIISFKDLDFDVKTKSLLLKSASWILNKRICDKIKSFAVINLRPQINKAKKEIELAINKNYEAGFRFSGKINSLNVGNIIALDNTLFIRINSRGTLSVYL